MSKCEFTVDQLATAVELILALWDAEHPDDPCGCLGRRPTARTRPL